MSIITDFETEALNYFHGVEDEVKKFASVLVPEVEQVAEIAFSDLAKIAGQAVIAELPFVISGSEKFGNAVTHVVQSVEAQGKSVVLQTAQAAVQLAYLTAQNVVQGK